MNVVKEIFTELKSDEIITSELLRRKVSTALCSIELPLTEMEKKVLVSCIAQREDLKESLLELKQDNDSNSVDEIISKVEAHLKDAFEKTSKQEEIDEYHEITRRYAEFYIQVVEDHVPEFLNTEWSEMKGFQDRLYEAWGVPLSMLEVLIKITIDVGSRYKNRRKEIPSDEYFSYQALTRIHARACLVSNEILALLKAGYSEGALARWRTLHELLVVSLFIKKHGNDTAEQYIDHVEMASIRAGLEFQSHSNTLGYEPYSEEDVLKMKTRKIELIQKHGEGFKNDYGWASVLKNRKKENILNPSFADIERSVQQEQMKPFTRRASQYIHAGPLSLFYQPGLHPETADDLYLTGPTNFGLSDSCINTAYWLNKITGTLTLDENGKGEYQYGAYQVVFWVLEDLQNKLEEAANRVDDAFNGSYKTTPSQLSS